MKTCNKCYEQKNASDFGTDLQKIDGLSSYCKDCLKKRSAHQKNRDKEKNKDYYTKYRNKNRIKIREYAQIAYYKEREAKLKKFREDYNKRKEEICKRRAKLRRTEEWREKNRKRAAAWRKKNQSKCSKIATEWKKRNPEKAACHAAMFWAIKSGALKRGEICESCGLMCKTFGHHDDYSKPLQVIWLCKSCHTKKHLTYR